jgi:hypothetical protein
MRSFIVIWVVMALVVGPQWHCTPSVFREVYPTLLDGKYDSEFPYKGCSQQLEEIASSVRMLNAIAYYRNFVFPVEEKITLERLREPMILDRAERIVYQNRTSSGSATTISASPNNVLFLTCEHIIHFEDTLITYYLGSDRKPTPYVRSYSIKERQQTYVLGLSAGGAAEILARDETVDLALVGMKVGPGNPFQTTVFRYPLGKAKELEWGAFVYVYGYPSGHRMVTKAIVSNPNKDRRGSFLIDAGFKRGFSGGVVLAIRDGVPNFELVGLVRAAKGTSELFVSPVREGETIEFDSSIPYHGELFVEQRSDIDYGVAETISAETIAEFLARFQNDILNNGYLLPWASLQAR